jgi:hypothetical protein
MNIEKLGLTIMVVAIAGAFSYDSEWRQVGGEGDGTRTNPSSEVCSRSVSSGPIVLQDPISIELTAGAEVTIDYRAFVTLESPERPECLSFLRLTPPVDEETGAPMTSVGCPDAGGGFIFYSPCTHESALGTLVDTEGYHGPGCPLDHSPADFRFNMQASTFSAADETGGATISFSLQAVDQNTGKYSNTSTVRISIKEPCEVVRNGASEVEIIDIEGTVEGVGLFSPDDPDGGDFSTEGSYDVAYNTCTLTTSEAFGIHVEMKFETRVIENGLISEKPGPTFEGSGSAVCSTLVTPLAGVDPCGGDTTSATIEYHHMCDTKSIRRALEQLAQKFGSEIERENER